LDLGGCKKDNSVTLSKRKKKENRSPTGAVKWNSETYHESKKKKLEEQ